MPTCPLCKGTGESEPHDLPAQERKELAIKLVSEGYSYRQAMRACGWKSPASVSKVMKAHQAALYKAVAQLGNGAVLPGVPSQEKSSKL